MTWPPANGSLRPAAKPAAASDRERRSADPAHRRCGPRQSPNTTGGNPGRRRRHRMAIEQQRAAEAVEQQRRAAPRSPGDRAGAPGSSRSSSWSRRDRPPPQIAVLLRPRRDDAEPAARPRADPAAAGAVDHRRVDLVLGAVAIDRGARRAGDDRAAARAAARATPAGRPAGPRARQRRLARRRHVDQPVGIVAARMRHRQQHRQVAARRVDDGARRVASRLNFVPV